MSYAEIGVEDFPEKAAAHYGPPIEERMLTKVRLLRGVQREYLPTGKDRNDAIEWCDQIEDYLKQAIADRDWGYERDMDMDADFTDPFADDPDPEPESLPEESMLSHARCLWDVIRGALPEGDIHRESGRAAYIALECYLSHTIADRDRDYERDMDEDPFADDPVDTADNHSCAKEEDG